MSDSPMDWPGDNGETCIDPAAAPSLPAAAESENPRANWATDLLVDELRRFARQALTQAETWTLAAASDRLYALYYDKCESCATLRSTLEAREQELAIYRNQGSIVSLAAFQEKCAALAAREQRIGELTSQRDEYHHERDIAALAVASREARIGELENENSALRSRL